MENSNDRISLFHTILLFIMSVGLINHVIIIPALMDVAKRDAWISVLFAIVIFSIWVWLIYYIAKGTGQQNIYQWIKIQISPTVAKLFVFMVCFFLFSTVAVTMTDMTSWTHIMYLPTTPQLIIVISFILVCFLAANTNILTITIANGILLPLVIVLGYFVFAANLPQKDYSLLFPVFEHGFSPMLQGMIYSGAGLAEVFIIIFLQHRLKTPIRYWYLVILIILLGYLTVGPVTGGIAAFGPVDAAKQRFPAYELWSLVHLGRFIEHVDFFSIYQWLSGAFIRISLALFIIVDVLNIETGWKRSLTLLTLAFMIILLTLMPMSDMQFIVFLSNIFLPVSLIFLIACSLFLSACVFIVNRKNSHTRGIQK